MYLKVITASFSTKTMLFIYVQMGQENMENPININTSTSLGGEITIILFKFQHAPQDAASCTDLAFSSRPVCPWCSLSPQWLSRKDFRDCTLPYTLDNSSMTTTHSHQPHNWNRKRKAGLLYQVHRLAKSQQKHKLYHFAAMVRTFCVHFDETTFHLRPLWEWEVTFLECFHSMV